VKLPAPLWIQLQGAVNARDLGGMPAEDGLVVRPCRLIRSGTLQTLTPADVRLLVDDYDVRAVADLRSPVEVAAEGPGPLTREPRVRIESFSLFRVSEIVVGDGVAPGGSAGAGAGAGAASGGGAAGAAPIVLPWQERDGTDKKWPGPLAVYRNYLRDRPDSVVAALRLIARSDGATIVHCAAGKDRTGVVVALALDEAGVAREAIVADYARSGECLDAILAGLAASPTYANDVGLRPANAHLPRAETMRALLAGLDRDHGGTGGWLRAHGWSDDDGAALRAKLFA